MSLRTKYENRTAWKYQPICGQFSTGSGLSLKVDGTGNYVPFQGSTVVFRPEERCIQKAAELQRFLHCQLDQTGMLANPLPLDTVHMTLHDLYSPENGGCSGEAYACLVEESLNSAAELVEGIHREFAGCQISMAADRIVNMVSKSLVLLLRPAEEQDFKLLLEWYRRFDCIVPLSYPLTPHITLAYYRPGMLDGNRLGKAVSRVQIQPECRPVFAFGVEKLAAQRFLDMQTYQDVSEQFHRSRS